MNYLIVFLGAGIGGALRHGVNTIVPKLVDTAFPLHTLIINVLGSLVMGLIAEVFALKSHLPAEGRLFLMTGILGGFTTFSAFSLDAALLYERGDLGGAAVYVAASVVLSVGGLFAGLFIIRQLIA
jgi:CrcB protein